MNANTPTKKVVDYHNARIRKLLEDTYAQIVELSSVGVLTVNVPVMHLCEFQKALVVTELRNLYYEVDFRRHSETEKIKSIDIFWARKLLEALK